MRFYLAGVMTLAVLCAVRAHAAGLNSTYLSLADDTRVTSPNQILLTAKISGEQSVLICADGDFRPLGGGVANVFITVDGEKVSNDTIISWNGSRKAVMHTFRAIATLRLSAGTHAIAVSANGTKPFMVDAGANLSIMMEPARTISTDALQNDSGVVEVDTASLRNGVDPLPLVAIDRAEVDAKAGEPIVLLAAGDSIYAGAGGNRAGAGGRGNGDAMWGLWIDGKEAPANSATYADNDIFDGAEWQAPMFLQGIFALPEGKHSVALGASAEPWPAEIGVDGVRYKVGAGTRLIALQGGMTVAGRAVAIDAAHQPVMYNRFPYLCIASAKKWPACPAMEQDVTVSTGTISVPKESNGVVFISANTRVQGDQSDRGGKFEMWLTVDGVKRGSVGRQELSAPSSVSTRTVAVSYLATGENALAPGQHVVHLHVRASGDFVHLCITRNMPIAWFD